MEHQTDIIDFFTKDATSMVRRSMRLNGGTTSVRLENLFWKVVQDIAREQNLSVGMLLNEWQDCFLFAGADGENFASFVRVRCMQAILARQHPERDE